MTSSGPANGEPEIDANVDLDLDLAQAFRPAKKRKVFRARRSTSPTAEESATTPFVDSTAPPPPDAALRWRQQAAKLRRTKGIEFGSASGSGSADTRNHAEPLTGVLDETPSVGANRFAPQTGHTVEVDRHMMAYVDAELTRRSQKGQQSLQTGATHQGEQAVTDDERDEDEEGDDEDAAVSSTETSHPKLAARQPATLGKIQEVTLPESSSVPTKSKPARPPRVRRGRDGRVLPPRRRARRGSADLARDALVESLMHEHLPEAAGGGGGGGGGVGIGLFQNDAAHEERLTDETMAERFRQEWADHRATEDRRREGREKERGKEEERLKGPKLGGSRSQRMAVRERELEAQRLREKKPTSAATKR